MLHCRRAFFSLSVFCLVFGPVCGLADDARQVSAGGCFTCSATTAGGVKCWGSMYECVASNSCRFGDSVAPVDVIPPGSSIVDTCSSYKHACALTATGGVKCWGKNDRGQLGIGTLLDQNVPAEVVGLDYGAFKIACGNTHTCALMTNGTVKCWGANEKGQLGDGTTSDHWTPVDVIGLSSGVSAVSVGDKTSCALLSNGAAKCWGDNAAGSLGNGSYVSYSSSPVAVSGLSSGTTLIAAGGNRACAVLNTGAMKCWGNWRLSPVDVVGIPSGIVLVAMGTHHQCILANGGVKCWGSDLSGQVGNGSEWHFTSDISSPTDVYGLSSGVAHISAGYTHSCAVTNTGDALCWGENTMGQLGNRSTVFPSGQCKINVPVDVEGIGSVPIAPTATPTPTPTIQPTPTVTPTPYPTPPAGPVGVSINNGAMYTKDSHVTLKLIYPQNTSSILIANDGGFSDAVSFATGTEVLWQLSTSGAERLPKIVYVRFNPGTQTYSDDIILDQATPVVSSAKASKGRPGGKVYVCHKVAGATQDLEVPLNSVQTHISHGDTLGPCDASGAIGNWKTVKSRYIRVTISAIAKDTLSGVVSMRVEQQGKPVTPWLPFKKKIVLSLNTAKSLVVRVQDGAGNQSTAKKLLIK